MRIAPFIAAVSILLFCRVCVGQTPAWEDKALQRIEEHRKADLTVTVIDGQGQAIQGAEVKIEMTRHAFGFGTAVNAKYLATGEGEDLKIYRSKILKLFNCAVLENGHKWDNWETPERKRQTVAASEWLLANDIHLRGHTMIWQRRQSVPEDVKKIAWPGDEDWKRKQKPTLTEAQKEELRRRSFQHIRRIGEHRYENGRVAEWDVVNEPIHVHGLADLLNPEAPVTAAPLLASWYKAAGKAAPNAVLYINDYGMVNRGGRGAKRRYEQLCRFLLESRAPLGGIGFQAHIGNGGHAPSGEELTAFLDRFGALGLRLKITEFDMWGGGWGQQGNPTRSEWVRTLLTVCFSNPSVDGILMWGFWDARHWKRSAPLFKKDWTLKPEGKVWMDLVHSQWKTQETALTDAAGKVRIRGFLGDYRITAGKAGQAVQQTLRLEHRGGQTTVALPD